MTRIDKRLLAMAIAILAAGLLLALAFENPLVRYALGVSTFAVGLGLLRRALRVE